jgi:hypothetical protein
VAASIKQNYTEAAGKATAACGRDLLRAPGGQSGYNSLEILLKVRLTLFPRVINPLMMITDINAAMSAYSIAVTARRSWNCVATRTQMNLIKSANI